MLIPWRIIIAILGSIGMAIIYGLKVNLSMAIVSMVDQTVIEETNKTKTVQSKVTFWYYKYRLGTESLIYMYLESIISYLGNLGVAEVGSGSINNSYSNDENFMECIGIHFI